MNLEMVRLTLGPLPNNVYLLADSDNGDAVVIDPSFDAHFIVARLERMGWQLQQIWLTHGHFDHFAGAKALSECGDPPLPVGLHPADRDWYTDQGGAKQFGLSIPQPPAPSIWFSDGMALSLTQGGPSVAKALHAPGHSLGHVMFYCQSLKILFCGDVIFRQGIGRTDLAGGDQAQLLQTIRQKVFTLPDETRLLPGHGPETTVGFEKQNNPFLA